MLTEKETNRVLRRFRRELGVFSHKMGGVHRERQRTLEEARTASEVVLNIAQMLANRTEPAKVETVIKRDTGARSDQVTVYLELEGQGIGYFWIDPGDWLISYGVSGRYTHFFRRALKKFGDLLIRKEAYRQLLLHRLASAQQLVQMEFGHCIQAGQLQVETGYRAASGWDVDKDYYYLRLISGDWKRTLRVYNDRYTWGVAFKEPSITLNTEEEMIGQLRQVLIGECGQQPTSRV